MIRLTVALVLFISSPSFAVTIPGDALIDFRVEAWAPVGNGPYSTHVAAWQDTGIWLEPGDTFALQAEGLIWVAPPFTPDRSFGPDGHGGLYCAYWDGIDHCLTDVPYSGYALVGKIGESLGNEFLVGSEFSGIAQHTGFLYLALNDSHYTYNSGFFLVNSVPEPSALLLLASGLAGLAFRGSRRGERRNRSAAPANGLSPAQFSTAQPKSPRRRISGDRPWDKNRLSSQGGMRAPRSITFIAGVSIGLSSPSAASPIFMGLGDIPGGDFHSLPFGVSGDGSIVVGWSISDSTSGDGREAFRWSIAEGIVPLGRLPGGVGYSEALGISDDGNVIVGGSNSPLGNHAVRWTEVGWVPLEAADPFDPSRLVARDVSGDGSVIAGMGATPFGSQAFRWTADGGMVHLEELPGGGFTSVLGAISDDGSVIVGNRYSTAGTVEAFRWTLEDGMIGLGDLPGGIFGSQQPAVSPDGSIVVGASFSAAGYEAFRWTATEGMVGLGDLVAANFWSQANGVTENGTIVGGSGSDTDPNQRAFIWDELNGMRSLQEVLVNDLGLDLTGWSLRSAHAISSDGRTIVGYGHNPSGNREAWIAVIPEPTTALLFGTGLLGLAVRRRRRGTTALLISTRTASPSVGAVAPHTPRRASVHVPTLVLIVAVGLPSASLATPTAIVDLQVPGDVIWFNSNVAIASGEVLSLTATGMTSGCLPSCPTSPDGWDPFLRPQSLVPHLSAYALLGRVGANGDPFFIGSSFTGVIGSSGSLFFTMNDEPGAFGDNSGFWTVNGAIDTVPEPSTALLLVAGLAGLAVRGRRAALSA